MHLETSKPRGGKCCVVPAGLARYHPGGLLSAFCFLLSAAKCRAWDLSSAHAMREVRPKITMVREVYESDYKYDSAEQYGAG